MRRGSGPSRGGEEGGGQGACHIDKPQVIVRQRDITRHVISPISARRAVSGSHLLIAIIAVAVRLPTRGSASAETVPVTMSGPRPGSAWRFRSRVGTLSAPSARPATCGASAPCGSGSGRLVDGAGTPARISRTLTIAGRDYGKGEGGRPLRPSGRGHSAFRSVLKAATGGDAPPLESPAIAERRSPACGTAPSSLVSIEVCGRSIAGVSSQRLLSPAREAAFRVGPLGDASSASGTLLVTGPNDTIRSSGN